MSPSCYYAKEYCLPHPHSTFASKAVVKLLGDVKAVVKLVGDVSKLTCRAKIRDDSVF